MHMFRFSYILADAASCFQTRECTVILLYFLRSLSMYICTRMFLLIHHSTPTNSQAQGPLLPTPETHTHTFKHTPLTRNSRTQHGLLPAPLPFFGRPLFMPLYKYFRQFGGVYKLSFAPVPQATFYVLSGVL